MIGAAPHERKVADRWRFLVCIPMVLVVPRALEDEQIERELQRHEEKKLGPQVTTCTAFSSAEEWLSHDSRWVVAN